MSYFDSILLGVVQALTEFLPVSSSGHLVVFQELLNTKNVPLAYDVLLHLATLLVVFVYLKDEILVVIRSALKQDESGTQARKLILLVVVASVPAAIVGIGFRVLVEQMFESTAAASFGFFITTVFLVIADRKQHQSEEKDNSLVSDISWPLPNVFQALLIGLAQAIAITPGVSRSGATIATSLILGLPVQTALKFSFLISIPAILGAGLLEATSLLHLNNSVAIVYLAGFVAATIVGVFALRMLIFVTNKKSLRYFAIYTFCLGLLLQLT